MANDLVELFHSPIFPRFTNAQGEECEGSAGMWRWVIDQIRILRIEVDPTFESIREDQISIMERHRIGD